MNKVDDHWNNKVRGLMSFVAIVSLIAPKSVRNLREEASVKPTISREVNKVLESIHFRLVLNIAIAPKCLERFFLKTNIKLQ